MIFILISINKPQNTFYCSGAWLCLKRKVIFFVFHNP